MVISACEHKINGFGAIKKFVGAFFSIKPTERRGTSAVFSFQKSLYAIEIIRYHKKS